jgi:hypothetical protein
LLSTVESIAISVINSRSIHQQFTGPGGRQCRSRGPSTFGLPFFDGSGGRKLPL